MGEFHDNLYNMRKPQSLFAGYTSLPNTMYAQILIMLTLIESNGGFIQKAREWQHLKNTFHVGIN